MPGTTFLSETALPERSIVSCFAAAGATVICPDHTLTEIAFADSFGCAYELLLAISRRRAQLGGKKSTLTVAGRLFGGTLAAGLALKARDDAPDMVDGQVLISPLLDPLMSSRSFRCADGCLRDSWSEGWYQYLGGILHPYGAPSYCSRLIKLVPTLMLTVQDHPLCDESMAYAQRMIAAGVCVHEHVLPPENHSTNQWGKIRLQQVTEVFRSFLPTLPRAGNARIGI
jgi:acetyl esterase/lipase